MPSLGTQHQATHKRIRPTGNHNAHDGYRPITLTCCFAKILERVVLNRIHPIVDPCLDACQAGFRWGSDIQTYSLLETLLARQQARTYWRGETVPCGVSTVPELKMVCGIWSMI